MRLKKTLLFNGLSCLILIIGQLVIGCDKCKYAKSNSIILDYASVTFSLCTISETYQVNDYFEENSGHNPDSIRLYNINHEQVTIQRNPNKNEFTFYYVDEKTKKKLFSNIIVQYYYLSLNRLDTDTLKIEMKGQYTGNCDNETFELMRMFYNNTMVINGATKGQIAFGFKYNKK